MGNSGEQSARTVRTATAYVHGVDGPVVVLPARACAVLDQHINLIRLRGKYRADLELYQILVALTVAAAAWNGSDQRTRQDKPSERDPRSTLTATQAADLAGVTPRAIQKACAAGRLPATRHGDVWQIQRQDVEHYRAGRRAA